MILNGVTKGINKEESLENCDANGGDVGDEGFMDHDAGANTTEDCENHAGGRWRQPFLCRSQGSIDCVGDGDGRMNRRKSDLVLELCSYLRNQESDQDLYSGFPEDLLLQLKDYAGKDLQGRRNSRFCPVWVAVVFDRLKCLQVFCRLGYPVDGSGNTERSGTPLFVAAHSGRYLAVQVLVAHGANVNFCMPSDNASVLYAACKYGSYDIVDFLGAHGADASLSKSNGMTPLHVASQNGFARICKLLLSRFDADVHSVAKSGSNALHLASFQDRLDVIQVLIDSEANVDADDENGWTPIHVAAQSNNARVVKLLANARIHPKSKLLRYSQADLHDSIRDILSKQLPSCFDSKLAYELQQLLGKSQSEFPTADKLSKQVIACLRVNRRKIDGYTPLMVACRTVPSDHVAPFRNCKCSDDNGYFLTSTQTGPRNTKEVAHERGNDFQLMTSKSILHTLVALGANPALAIRECITAFMVAANHGGLERLQYLRTMLSDQQIVETTSKNCWNALYYAAKAGRLPIVRYLLTLEASDGSRLFPIDQTVPNGLSPLYIAAHYGHLNLVKVLVEEFDALVDLSGVHFTPLYTACKHGHIEAVKYFFSRRSHCGKVISESLINTSLSTQSTSALHIASKYNHLEVVRFLVEGVGYDPRNLRVKSGWTAFHTAASFGAIDVLKYFVTKFGPETVSNSHTITDASESNAQPTYCPLHLAAASGHMNSVRFLARPEFCGFMNYRCESPAKLAGREGHASVAYWLERSEKWNSLQHFVDSRDLDGALKIIQSEGCTNNYLFCSTDSPIQLCLNGLELQAEDALIDTITGSLSISLGDSDFMYLREWISRWNLTSSLFGEYNTLACPVDFALVEIIVLAMLPWRIASYSLYPLSHRKLVFTMLLVNQRKKLLAPELVLKILSYIGRNG